MIINPAIKDIFSRVTAEDISQISKIVPKLTDPWAKEWCTINRQSDRWMALTNRFCTHFVPESRARTLLSDAIPAEGIHFMQRSDTWYVGDFYSTNMLLESLALAGLKTKKDENYLDFGCSSGSLVRALAAYQGDASCYGVDPVENSILWAQKNLPRGTFTVSNQNPPLEFEDNFFNGVSAISIWSHFSEEPTLKWFDEMARIIKPEGWLFFTTHGKQTIRRARKLGKQKTETTDRIETGMLQNRFHFEDVFGGHKHYGLETPEWGNSFILPVWLLDKLSENWDLRLFQEGRNQSNQDCYVFVRR